MGGELFFSVGESRINVIVLEDRLGEPAVHVLYISPILGSKGLSDDWLGLCWVSVLLSSGVTPDAS